MRSLRLAAPVAVLLCVLAPARPSHAQFGSLRETADTPVIDASGKIVFKPNTVFFSPLTTFQRTGASVGTGAQGGQIFSFKASDAGPMALYEKLYRVDAGRPSYKGREGASLSLGTWYWYHNNAVDRFAVYGKYFFNRGIGAQISVGGDTHTGVNEYYGFLLYNVVRSKPKLPVGVQVGVGPYFPRASLGGSGYTYTAAAAYSLSPDVSIVASLWYVNFKARFPTFGFSDTSTTARYTVGVGYSF